MRTIQREERVARDLDWVTVGLYGLMVLLGWLNIYAAVYDPANQRDIFDLGINSGKQLLWIGTSVLLIIAILVIDFRFYESFAYVIYGLVILSLVAVLGVGTEVKGAKAWFQIGEFRLQPAEFAKMATGLALAKYLSGPLIRLDRRMPQLIVAALIGLPAVIILLQNDTGSTLVFGTFIIVLFREGLPPVYPILGLSAVALLVLTLLVPNPYWLMGGLLVAGLVVILLIPKRLKNILTVLGATAILCGVVFGIGYFISDVLQPHQQIRLKVLVDPNIDPLGAGWNVTQSKIAIGSGGFWGKGFTDGTQTKFDFVPEQSTDFIFCTIGEEHGWVGSLVVLALFIGMLMRLVFLAERQKSRFGRVYGYSVASIFFFHFLINIGMTIGLFPVIGIPLPFFSYGGSSLWSFTILLFILLKIDAHRGEVLFRG